LKSENNILNIENKELIYDVVAKELEYSDSCSTGDKDHLIYKLKLALEKAKRVDIIVAFLMESGVKLIEQELLALANKNVPIRILTGNYLNITQPQALYLLKGSLGDKVDLRFYNVKNKSFHPKAYIFEYEDGGDIFIGSSNISRSALTSGIEWNYKISKSGQEEDFKHYKNVFEDLFLNQADIIDEEKMREYSKNWRRPKVFVEVEKQEEEEENKIVPMISPKGAQIEALYELNNSRLEGADKAIVVAATGVGKTYLAAFDSKHFSKILFVAHREEILNQAEASFRKVRGNINTGFFTGNKKDESVEVLFATVQTLGQSQYLDEKYFKKDYFDYIIIDEFHHAVAGNYQNIINYFEPKFLLGLTATPERLDNKDVFALCDYNVVYEVRLKDAVNKGWLVPFRYYGIYDDTQYENIDNKNGKYNEKQLEKALMIEKRRTLIFKHYSKYKSEKALGFCSSRNHAEYMAKYFCDAGIKACAVYSGEYGEYSLERKEALELLTNGELKVIFSVDMFNEGLDVPAVDLVMFLRPTESPTVFLQQLGRGLRKYKDKKYLNVLDFIGNYKKANLVPFFLTGDPKNAMEKAKGGRLPSEEEYPDDCIVDFQFEIIDIFKRQAEAQIKYTELKDIVIKGPQISICQFVIDEYYRIKEYVQEIPSRVQFYTYFDDDLYQVMKKNGKNNVFKDYFWFLNEIGQDNDDEKNLIGTNAHEFIKMIENTAMSKSYKMPIFNAFFNRGDIKFSLDEDDIYLNFKSFYTKGTNYVDLTRHNSGKNYSEWGKKQFVNLSKKNPEKFLLQSASEFFYMKNNYFNLNEKLKDYKDNIAFITHFKDAIEYRTRKYYKERL
jgi:superfamily II DNA or RNA helicase/HKD family nuclease